MDRVNLGLTDNVQDQNISQVFPNRVRNTDQRPRIQVEDRIQVCDVPIRTKTTTRRSNRHTHQLTLSLSPLQPSPVLTNLIPNLRPRTTLPRPPLKTKPQRPKTNFARITPRRVRSFQEIE